MLIPFLRKLVSKIVIFRGFNNFFQNYWILIESILLILIESPNIFHYQNEQKKQSGCGFRGKHLGHIRSNVVKKQKNWYHQYNFFIFCMRNTFKKKK